MIQTPIYFTRVSKLYKFYTIFFPQGTTTKNKNDTKLGCNKLLIRELEMSRMTKKDKIAFRTILVVVSEQSIKQHLLA